MNPPGGKNIFNNNLLYRKRICKKKNTNFDVIMNFFIIFMTYPFATLIRNIEYFMNCIAFGYR